MTPSMLLAATALAAGAAQEPPVFAAGTEVVRIEALVTRGAELVEGLRPEDFQVKDNGVPQRVTSVAFEEIPVDVLLVLDLSFSVTGPKLVALRRAAQALLDGLGPEDRAALVGFREWTRLVQPFTHDRSRVRAALQRTEGAGATALYDAVYAALHLWEPANRRRALVVFSDGVDNQSWLPAEDVVASAAWCDATVYAVTARGPDDPSHAFLREVARATGGRTWEARKGDELRARFLDVLSDIRGRYVLSYSPTGVASEGWHQVEVKLRGRRGDVLARPGYRRRDTGGDVYPGEEPARARVAVHYLSDSRPRRLTSPRPGFPPGEVLPLRILVDVTHPAHAHFFRHSLSTWSERGHELLVTSRDKDLNIRLLDDLGIPHEPLGRARSGLLGLALELVTRTAQLRSRVRRFRPDVMTAVGGPFIAQAGWTTGVPTIVFYDTENATLSNLVTYPFCTTVVTPHCYEGWVPRRKHLTYAGYQELAYTHPTRFSPDPSVLSRFGLRPGEPFVVMRLVSWGAAHDITDHGFTSVETAVRDLSRHARVLISSERSLPPPLEALRITGPRTLVHHLLAHARLFIGESATMASESATLGVPAIFVSTSKRGYTNEQERRYGITFNFTDGPNAQQRALRKATELLERTADDARWRAIRRQMLADLIDVTGYVVEAVEEVASRPPGFRGVDRGTGRSS